MNIEENSQLTVGICRSCKGSGLNAYQKKCNTCKGASVGIEDKGGRLVWARILTPKAIALRSARLYYKGIRVGVLIAFTAICWTWFGWLVRENVAEDVSVLTSSDFWFSINAFWFWIGGLFLAYALSLMMRFYREVYRVSDVRGQQTPDIQLAMSDGLLDTIDNAYKLAATRGDSELSVMHLLLSLAEVVTIQNMFIRLSVHPDVIKNYAKLKLGDPVGVVVPVVPQEICALLFNAFLEAEKTHQLQVRPTELLLVCIRAVPNLQEKLYELGAEMRKINNVIEWERSRAQLKDQLRIFRKIAQTRPTKGIDRAMTAIATPLLNQFSKDVTLAAQFGYTGAIVGRDEEIDNVLRLFEGGAEGALLVGDPGVGKMAIVEGIAQRMVLEEVPDNLKDKRLVLLQISTLLSGVSASEASERMLVMLMEVQKAGNIVMCIPDIHTLVAAREGGEGALNVAGVVKEVVERSDIPVIGTTSPEYYRRVIKGSALESLMTPIDISQMDSEQTVQVLQTKVGLIEYKQNVFFSYDALEAISDFARKHLQDQQMPESAIDLMKEVAVSVKNNKGAGTLVSQEDVAEVVSARTDIPVASITEEEGDKLMRLEELMHKRIIGQEEAVEAVANALRRSGAKLTSGKRPIANFLFVGPTGVGKTQLAKTISSVYFGGEDKMIRVDMSEFQDSQSIYRLIGQPDKKGSGILSEAVRSQPFSLLLLDELEKADAQVLNIFLQVMDDGRITDSVGRVVDFTNVILIATSNAGSQFIQDQMNAGVGYEHIKEGLLTQELRQHFTPEFLNRFDGVIVFHPLGEEHIKKVAGLMISDLARGIEEQYGAELVVTDAALEELAKAGFDPQFGARPMRRAIQEHVENAVAKVLLEQSVGRGQKIVYDVGGKVDVE